MGIERRLASYTTLYAGTPDRITNLQLGVSLLNGALVAPAPRSRSTTGSASARSSAASGRRR